MSLSLVVCEKRINYRRQINKREVNAKEWDFNIARRVELCQYLKANLCLGADTYHRARNFFHARIGQILKRLASLKIIIEPLRMFGFFFVAKYTYIDSAERKQSGIFVILNARERVELLST